MTILDFCNFLLGVITVVATGFTIIVLAVLHYENKGKDKELETLRTQVYELRRKNIEKARKERETLTSDKKKTKKRGRV